LNVGSVLPLGMSIFTLVGIVNLILRILARDGGRVPLVVYN
jgi:hypothetical protein